ncbi:MAG: thiol oxidoreductase [Alphaproteobacteria bacterium]|nr:thiol oxidoreductase [Alphaproteobacteria bacterium]
MQQFRFGRLALVLATLMSGFLGLAGTVAAQSVGADTIGSSTPRWPKPIDPGPRGGPPGAGGPLPGLSAYEQQFFAATAARFQEIDSVSGAMPGETGVGLGPRFNSNGCASCHAQPTVGGTSPSTNPQVAVATLDGARNTVPSFIALHGPVREARFIRNPDGTPDGGVHDLFVISGRADAPGCNIAQPDFATELAQNNVTFRIPTPLFGLGLVENVPDSSLEADQAANGPLMASLGIRSKFNRSANDGTITRFGWKAQNKSMLMFAGEAYNVEIGVTNELFPNERDDTPSCQFNPLPKDATNLSDSDASGIPASDYSSDIVNFAAFMRLSAGAAPVSATPSTTRGQQVFNNIGCNLCHIAQHTTAASIFTNQSNVTFSPFSDFALHDMGSALADGIAQGNATGSEFRTAPLWGTGQRLFFLHDGRTSDLYQAITAHASKGSEANAVVANFEMLSAADQQALLNFLRSL